jgi:hypothetical protein
MAGYLKHPHVFEQRTLCVLESLKVFIGAKFRRMQIFFLFKLVKN